MPSTGFIYRVGFWDLATISELRSYRDSALEQLQCDCLGPRCQLLHVPAQVVILDTKNQKVPTGEIGEVCIRGPNVTKGYLNRPEANEEAYAGQLLTLLTALPFRRD